MRSTMTAYSGVSSSRAPPNVASSALIPSARPRAFTLSRNGCGKVFSRPTSSPIFLDIGAHHLHPKGPVVRPARPDVEPDVDALVAQDRRQADGFAEVAILGTG